MKHVEFPPKINFRN